MTRFRHGRYSQSFRSSLLRFIVTNTYIGHVTFRRLHAKVCVRRRITLNHGRPASILLHTSIIIDWSVIVKMYRLALYQGLLIVIEFLRIIYLLGVSPYNICIYVYIFYFHYLYSISNMYNIFYILYFTFTVSTLFDA